MSVKPPGERSLTETQYKPARKRATLVSQDLSGKRQHAARILTNREMNSRGAGEICTSFMRIQMQLTAIVVCLSWDGELLLLVSHANSWPDRNGRLKESLKHGRYGRSTLIAGRTMKWALWTFKHTLYIKNCKSINKVINPDSYSYVTYIVFEGSRVQSNSLCNSVVISLWKTTATWWNA